MRLLVIAAPLFAAAGSPAKAVDDLCEKLSHFEKTIAVDNEKRPKWIDVHWNYDPSSIFSIACQHHNIAASRAFCSFISGSVSMEFAGRFPERILICQKKGRNGFASRRFLTKTLVWKTRIGSRMFMQTGRLADGGGPWLRLAVFPRGVQVSSNALPKAAPFAE